MSESASPQIALVTGATRGIGAAIAAELAQRGLRVIGTATTDEGAQRIAQALAAYGGKGVKLNVTDGAAVDALVDAIVMEHGGLHVLVNNAGITRDTLAMRMKDDDWDAVLDTNLKAVFRGFYDLFFKDIPFIRESVENLCDSQNGAKRVHF